MTSIRRILGIIVVLLGVVLVALPYSGLIASTVDIPEAKSLQAAEFAPQIYGGGTLKLSWSGAGPSTTVTVFSCPGDPSCSLSSAFSSLSQVATGSGASGSLSASVSGGTTYLVIENGTTGGINASATVSGITTLTFIGVAVIVAGLVLVVLPVKARAGTPAPKRGEEEEPAPSGDEVYLPAPAVETPAAAPVQAVPMTEENSEIMAEREPEPEAVVSTAVSAGGSKRPPIKCASCGTMNEPWITNCRWCKRTLSSTG